MVAYSRRACLAILIYWRNLVELPYRSCWRMKKKKRNSLKKATKAICAHQYVSNERNRRAAIWSGFRFNPRFVRLPNASADAVLCQLSSTVDPFGFFHFLFEVFRMGMNRDPYRIRWLFTVEWFPSHPSSCVADSKMPRLFI